MQPNLKPTPLFESPGPVTNPQPGASRAPVPDPARQSKNKNILRIPSMPGFSDPRFGPAVNKFLEKCSTAPNTNMQLTIERMRRMVDGDHDIQADPTRLDGYVMVGRKPQGRVTLNYMGADGLKFVSMLMNNSPEAKVEPTDPDDLDSCMAAEVAQDVLDHWLNEIDMPSIEAALARTFWISGTAYTYVYLKGTENLVDVNVPEMADSGEPKTTGPADLYNAPEIDPQMILDSLQAGPSNHLDYDIEVTQPDDPRVSSGQPNPDIEKVQELSVGLYVTDAREVTVPTREFQTDCLPWLRFDQEWFIGRVVQEYGSQAAFLTNSEAYQGSGGDKLPGVQLTADLLRLSTDDMNNRRDGYVVVTKLWIDPVSYLMLPDEYAALFMEQYPDGAVVHIVRGRILRISHGTIKENWVIVSPDMDKRLLTKPKVLEIESGQVAVNTGTNYGVRALLRNIPTTIVDSSLMSPATIAAQRNNAYDVIRANLNGRNIQSLMGNLPTANFPKDLVPFLGSIRGAMQEIDGMLPPIFGMGAPASTFREGEARRMAAMGQSMLMFQSVQRWKRQVCTLALRIKAMFGIQEIRPKHKNPIHVHMDMKLDGWHIMVAPEIPASDIEVADSVREIMNQNKPEVLDALEIMTPQNRPRLHQLLSLKGFKSSVANIDAYCQLILQDLLSKPATLDPMTQVMYPPVRPNPDIEDPQAIIGYITNWIQEPNKGLIYKRRDPEAFKNVVRYISLYKAILKQQEMQAMMEQQAMGLPPTGPGQPPPPGQGGPPGPPPEPEAPPEPGGRPPTSEPPPGPPPGPMM